jgi:hypothetical protein
LWAARLWQNSADKGEGPMAPPLSLLDALKALIIVQRFVEHQEDATANNTALLHQIEQQFNLQASKAWRWRLFR